ncbi:Carboxylesterase NlhH [Paraconexibacter sp. AEG42_29]|uniref:Carboxylesterase NlhH n=1 Tax=Paraconexibacter sp. AEG42_29 TaxID=2997339 RepID=A0AAU7AX54_9ACTN
MAAVDDAIAGGTVPVRVYRPLPAADGPAGVVVYTHGGGWRLGDLDGFDRIARALCAGSGHHVISVDYRLAPEHPFPAAKDDLLTVVDWAVDAATADGYGWDGERVVLVGDSAGAQLTAAATRYRRGRICAQILAYPALDATMSGASYDAFGPETMLTRKDMELCWTDYAGGLDPSDPELSPGLAEDLEGLPPAMIVLASHDVLRDDGVAYAERLRMAGVEVVLREVPGHVHGFLRWAGVVDAAGETLAAMGTYAAAAIAR